MGKTVMVVDDQPSIRLLFKEIIKQDGHRFIEAGNGKEALDIIKGKLPDLLVLDYNLPVLSGRDVLQALADHHLYIPVILMSGLPEKLEEDKEQFDMVKIIAAKPFDIMEIRNQMNKIIAEE